MIKAIACQITVLQAELTLIVNNGVELKEHRVDLHCCKINQYTVWIMVPCFWLEDLVSVSRLLLCKDYNSLAVFRKSETVTRHFPSHCICLSKITFSFCLKKLSMYHIYCSLGSSKCSPVHTTSAKSVLSEKVKGYVFRNYKKIVLIRAMWHIPLIQRLTWHLLFIPYLTPTVQLPHLCVSPQVQTPTWRGSPTSSPSTRARTSHSAKRCTPT